jgi:hypothetical protein
MTTTTTPKRVRITRTRDAEGKSWRDRHPDAVIVDRRGKWGNPFAHRTPMALARVPALDGSAWEYEDRISADGMRHDYFHPGGKVTRHDIRYMTLVECVELYERALTAPTLDLHLGGWAGSPWITAATARDELAGKDLACWCEADAVCHADVLLRIANEVSQ